MGVLNLLQGSVLGTHCTVRMVSAAYHGAQRLKKSAKFRRYYLTQGFAGGPFKRICSPLSIDYDIRPGQKRPELEEGAARFE